MPPVPILSPSDVIKILQRLGWEVVRQKGSHIIMTRPGHIATLSIPNHAEVARGTLRSLIAKAGLTIEQFLTASNK
jgi:predicted RNA binding protein YcfA (HicA-like mRNA interferase family)